MSLVSAIEFLKEKLGGKRPDVAIICGSGLSELSSLIEDPVEIPYTSIPGFPQPTVVGHKSELVYGTLEGKSILAMRGRFHFYEGHSPKKVSEAVQVFAALGCKMLVVTNAAGCLKIDWKIGDIMVISDHIYFPGMAGNHALVGSNDERFGPRFPPMTEPYSKDLQSLASTVAKEQGIQDRVRSGTYCCVSGPTYETRHEVQMLRNARGSTVGMSTVPEVVVATHAGMQVLGLSLVTNVCVGPDDELPAPKHDDVVAAVKEAGGPMLALVKEVVRRADTESMPAPKAVEAFEGKDAAAGGATSDSGSGSGGSWPSGREALYFFVAGAAVALGAVFMMDGMRKGSAGGKGGK